MKTPYRMKGFTLIELLAVVLIIGILVAVAASEYEKAAERSRASQGIAVLKTIYDAAKAYYMETGSYATSFDELIVDLPCTGNTKWTTISDDTPCSFGEWSFQLYNGPSKGIYAGRISGKYAGTGFGMFMESAVSQTPTGRLLCLERISDGITFSGHQQGDYCVDYFDGQHIYTGTMHEFVMP